MVLRGVWTVPLVLMLVGLELSRPEGGPAPTGKEPRNLVPNGDFEAGTDTPSGWQTVDGLTTFWVKDPDPRHGKVIRFDTDVYQSQAYDWWVQIARGASPRNAPRKIPTTGDKYDTLAGLDGVWFWSDYIAVEQGKAYWLTLDARGAGMMTWLVGYTKKGSTAFGADEAAFQEVLKEKVNGKPRPHKRGLDPFIHNYSWKGQLAVGASDGWATYARRKMPFRPTKRRPGFPPVHFVRVLVLPTWPPGTYYLDNVRLTEVEDRDAGE